MKRILVCGLVPDIGGLEKIVVDFYNHIDTSEFELEFLLQGPKDIDFSEHFKKLCRNKIVFHRIPKLRPHIKQALKEWDDFFKKNSHRYDILWSNQNALSHLEFLKLAKKYGIEKRIVHAHCAQAEHFHRIIHPINRLFVGKYATDFWACGTEALNHFYHGKEREKALVIHNAIEVEKFLYNQEMQAQLRKEYHIPEDCLVVGQVSRLYEKQKNQSFCVKVFSEIVKKEPNSRLVFIGRGDTSFLLNLAEQYGVADKVIFTGLKTNIGEMLNLLDVFFFPSNFEGLPIVLIEAQANGLPVVTASHLPDAKILENFDNHLSLTDSLEEWADKILSVRHSRELDTEKVKKKIDEAGYEIETATRNLEELFKH